jgi:hypothetical protein
MGERKVLNKYFPPDFDPLLVPRKKRPENMQIEVRMMLPFSIQCNNCGEYMYRGKKFNSRKEDVPLEEENYHGIRIFRFYIKCNVCNTEITFKTDPKNSDYAMEHGASRNFEAWRQEEDKEKETIAQRAEEEEGNSMKTLENRTLDSKMEMDILDALDEMKAINQRHERVDTDRLLREVHSSADASKFPTKLDDEDEALLKTIKFGVQQEEAEKDSAQLGEDGVKRLQESASDEDLPAPKQNIGITNLLLSATAKSAAKKDQKPKITIKRKPLKKKRKIEQTASAPKKPKAGGGGGGSSGSGSGSSSSSSGSGSGSSSSSSGSSGSKGVVSLVGLVGYGSSGSGSES